MGGGGDLRSEFFHSVGLGRVDWLLLCPTSMN